MNSSSWKPNHITIAFLFIATLLCANYFFFVYTSHAELTKTFFQDIIKGNIVSPYKYRLLFPYTHNFFQSLYEFLFGSKHSFGAIYFFLITISYFFSLFFSYKFFLLFHSKNHSFILALLLSFSIVVSHYTHYIHPWSMIEPALFSLGYIFAYKKKSLAFFIIAIVAILNRETGVFLSASYLLSQNSVMDYLKKPVLIYKNLYGVLCILVSCLGYIALRQIAGEADHAMTLRGIHSNNLDPYNFAQFALLFCLYFHIYLLYKFDFSTSDLFLKNQIPVLVISSLFIFVFGIWHEIRIFNSILPLYLCIAGYKLRTIFPDYLPKD